MRDNTVDVSFVLQVLRSAMDGCMHIKLSDGTNVLEHALWSAHQAGIAGCENNVVVAALFHDIGHYLCGGDPDLVDYYRDREHAVLAGKWLARWFPPAVCVPIELHVDAKRYLATVDLGYRHKLGVGSLQSLAHQGGLMSAEEVCTFFEMEYSEVALLVRHFDDTPYGGESLLPYSWYEPIVASVMR
jgi:gamma-butyrobetaine dioxygenase